MTSSTASLAIRPIQPTDFEAWLPLWLAYQDFYQVDLGEAVNANTFKRFLDPDEPVFAAVAEYDGELVGMVTWVIHRSTWSTTHYCYLEDLYVAPQMRGQGTGEHLIAWVKAAADQQQCTRLYWHTHQTNHRAQQLYNRVAVNPGTILYQIAL